MRMRCNFYRTHMLLY